MDNYLQETAHHPDYCWLFMDDTAPEDAPLPPFIPRVLNFDKSSNQSHESTLFHTYSDRGHNESWVQASNPIFAYQDFSDQSSVATGSEFSNGLPSVTHYEADCLSPSQFPSIKPQCCSRKRRSDYSYDDHPSKRKWPRSSTYDSTHLLDDADLVPSPVYTPSIKSSLGHLGEPPIGSNLSSWYHPTHPIVPTEAQNHEERNIQYSDELNESKLCIKFLLDEMSKVIESNRHVENPATIHQTIKRTEDRFKSFIQSSRIVSKIIDVQHTIESWDPVTGSVNTHNAFSRDCDASSMAPDGKFGAQYLPNPFDSTSYCCGTPLEGHNSCGCLLLSLGEGGSSPSEFGDTLGPYNCQSTNFLNPQN